MEKSYHWKDKRQINKAREKNQAFKPGSIGKNES